MDIGTIHRNLFKYVSKQKRKVLIHFYYSVIFVLLLGNNLSHKGHNFHNLCREHSIHYNHILSFFTNLLGRKKEGFLRLKTRLLYGHIGPTQDLDLKPSGHEFHNFCKRLHGHNNHAYSFVCEQRKRILKIGLFLIVI